MFCMHCGKQLEDGSRFCIYCGNSLEPAAEEPIVAAPPVPAPPVPPAPQEPYYAPQPPVEPAPIPNDANVYTDPVPPTPPKRKKGKKTGALIAIILVLLLLIGGGVGYYLYSQHVYEENMKAYEAAETLLEKGDYDGALEGFRALGNFEDAVDRAFDLEELQEDYDKALKLLDEHKFSDAAKAFQKLGDYRDSQNFVDHEIDYREACYLMETAGDAVDSEAIGLYGSAA